MQKKGRTTLPAGEAGAAVGEILVAWRGLDGADVAGRHAFKGARVTSNLSLSPSCVEQEAAAARGRKMQ
jgi:hypothetical protein